MEEFKNKISNISKEQNQAECTDIKSGPLVVVYRDPSKHKKKQKPSNIKSHSNNTNSKNEVPEDSDLIKAKHDVQKFVISGLQKSSCENAKIALAVSLGAVPPKKPNLNYKQYKKTKENAIKKQKKLIEMKEHVFTKKLDIMTNKKRERKRDKNKVVNFDSKFGKYGPQLKRQIKKAKAATKT